jgi:acyl-coenzyme A synthetase/AMP-(fatty) acid ligase
MQMDNVRDVTVYGEPNPITGRIVVACVDLLHPEDSIDLKKRLRAFCRDKLAPFKIPVKVEVAEQALFSTRYKKTRHMGQSEPASGTRA